MERGGNLELYKVYIDAKTYPNGIPTCVKVEKGDSIFVLDDETHSIGEKYKDYNATITEIFCEEKKWWQFWKQKIIYGYLITFE